MASHPPPGCSNLIEDSSTVNHRALCQPRDSEELIKRRQCQITIHMLSDDVLLEMFTFYVDKVLRADDWHMLIHVCRRWRTIVLASPRRLNLQLLCTSRRPMRQMPDVWLALPIVISDAHDAMNDTDSILAALEHTDRVREIVLENVPNQLLEEFAALPPDPFPVLTCLRLRSIYESPPVLPESFLGASAPRLRHLYFDGIPFPTVWKLLISAHDLVTLELWDIPHSGYISPEAMVSCLSAMTSLTTFCLQFRSPQSSPNRTMRHPPPSIRIVLPALTALDFKGVSEYLEDLVSRIDAPVLHMVEISFFNQLTFNIPQLPQFIDRLGKFKALCRADISFYDEFVEVALLDSKSARTGEQATLVLKILCSQPDWQPSSLAQLCGSSLHLLSTLESLSIHGRRLHSRPGWQDDMENTDWLDLLQTFTGAKELFLSETIAECVAPVLKKLPVDTVMGVMPTLRNVYLTGLRPSRPVGEAFQLFIATRQHFTHATAVYHWGSGELVAPVSGGGGSMIDK